ncbi:Monocopper oxidase-like protein sku5 [Asimina triloba]
MAAAVFPGAWTAVLVSLDNVGFWNIRAENLDSWHLGQEVYVRVVNPEITNKTELPKPDNALYCGALEHLQKPQTLHSKSSASSVVAGKISLFILVLIYTAVAIFQ